MFDQRFLFVLSMQDRQVLRTLARRQRMTQSAVLRDGLYRVAEACGVVRPGNVADGDLQEQATDESG